jgi:NAD(P)-dependent dehydrogenase (short-subunit alcohol dehydrogenase family)
VRIFVTGSTDGLGRGAADTLLQAGHAVMVHARSNGRLAVVRDLTDRGAAAVVGDLADADEVRGVAEQVNQHGPIDAVIHNAGVYSAPPVLPVNVVAPYLLTALLHRPGRLVYLSSSMHYSGLARVDGLDWSGRRATGSYSDSKLLVTTLMAVVAARWSGTLSNAVDPGWVPTRMGGPARR